MNSLYFILIAICFTAGVLVTSIGNGSNDKMKPVCEDKKAKVENDLKVVVKEDKSLGSWFTFEKE